MSIETRSSSALFKRAEQLKRWEESDTNRESITPKQKPRKVRFSSGCVFLAACAAGDKDEVLRLIEKGADIDTANVDGLTALHQACIDDNLDMVEFLVEQGADVNRGDNEGWTPLHATASCGFISIAKYLIEHGAHVGAVNNDGELPLDIAECEAMEDLLQSELEEQGIDCEAARSEEERIMLKDARDCLADKNLSVDAPHPKTGATALHVASAKGYIKVIKLLFQGGADIDKQDVDGWTPLHAAAHWGQKDAAQLLAESLADMDSKNYVGQTPFDLADPDMFRYLEDLKKRQNKEEVLNRRQAKKRVEVQDRPVDTETPTKLKRVEVKIEEKDSNVSDNIEKKNRVNSLSTMDTTVIATNDSSVVGKGPLVTPAPTVPPKPLVDNNTDDNMPSWRRPISRHTKAELSKNSFRERSGSADVTNENEVVLRRTNSFQNDTEFYTRYQALRARIQASSKPNYNSLPLHSSDPYIIAPSNNVQQQSRAAGKQPDFTDVTSINSSTTSSTVTSSTNSPTNTSVSPATSPLPNSQPVRRSFVPPVRDEESETQRKAHAKRVRETRRSTQGVTLEEIKSAEQLVKKKNNQTGVNNSEQSGGAMGDSSNGVSVTATITTATPTVPTREVEEPAPLPERRPSWRLRVDNGSKFKLEDATKDAEPPSTPLYLRRPGAPSSNPPRPASAPVETAETTTITLPLRRPKSQDDKEHDKENDVRNAQATLATQAAIQRRRRPKRRSTGVVAFDNLDDMEAEKDTSAGGDFEDSSKLNHEESGTERPNRNTRLGSSSDLVLRGENGEIDYKKLYEQALVDNERLKEKLKKSDEELKDTKQTLEKLNTVTSKNSLSELEKRERRAMERKLSEMEEELKQLQKLKAENERLRAENRALTRVVSKLTNSANK